MNKLFTKFISLFAFLILTVGGNAQADESTALKLVEHFSMGNNLEPMANQVAMQTVTVRGLQTKYEAIKVKFAVMDEIHALIPKYRDQWNMNLAKAYSKNLTNEEMLSIISLEKKSPYIGKMQSIQTSVGTEMQTISKPILGQLVGEAMLGAVQKLP